MTYRPGIGAAPIGPLTFPQGTSAFLAGQGTLGAKATLGAGAAETGAGTLAAAGQQETPAIRYSAGLSGPVVRPITFGAPVSGGIAALSGTGTLAAAGHASGSGGAALAGHGTLTAAGTSIQAVTFVIAAACGDASTSLTPSGWTALHTVSASNGTDHTGDTVLAAACSVIHASSATVTATAPAPEAMSGMILGVIANAPSPVPAGINQAWPYMVFEAAFGSGYQTPPDEMTWTNLQTVANGKRCLSWGETTGIQYELDALASSEVDLVLDNPDGALSPGNPSSPFYPDVVPGTPVRLRAVPPAATGCNAWVVIQRNMERWPQSWDALFRGGVNGTGNDQWSVISRPLPTAYRAEVRADQPYAWWPCDDPLITPVPTQLVNAAPCNSNHLQIVNSPNGLNISGEISTFPPVFIVYSASEAFAASSGWMYGDPVSAAWQQTGNGSGTTGRFLSCNDANFPPLSDGACIAGWWNLTFAATGSGETPGAIGQPAGSIVLWEIASDTAMVATLSLSSAGALQITIGGTTTTIYSSDLRNSTWFTVAVNLTATSWEAWVNGGVVAHASGTFGAISGAWDWFLANAGTGTAGGEPTAGTITGCGNVQVSHLEIYPQVLPAARVAAHAMAAYAAFGQLPAPSLTGAYTAVPPGSENFAYGPDGREYQGMFFAPPTIVPGNATLAALVTSTGGGYSSSVSAPESITIVAGTETTDGYMWLTATGIAPQYQWWTSAGAGDEESSGTSENGYLYVNSFGSGASPPVTASALGDTAQQRIERLLVSGNVTTPMRAIDASPTAMVAALDTGGQPCGSAVAKIAASDGGFLFVDTCGNLCYWDRPHLATMPVTWVLGEDTGNGEIPYEPDAQWDTDPQQCRNDISVTQLSVAPDASPGTGGAGSGSAETSSGLSFGPDQSRLAAVLASQLQNGDQPYTETSYLQDITQIQARSDWIFDTFGTPLQRVTNLSVDAASKTRSAPQSWLFVLSVNPGDILQATRRPPGQPSFTGKWRISEVKRKIDFKAGTASATVVADVLPSYYPA